jgi:tetratricopeptide (TPR) repeat protein
MDKKLGKNRSFLICLALAISTFAVFYQVRSFAFINLDDQIYVYDNPNIQSGLTLDTVKWAFNIGYAVNWHPLTWLSHSLDWQLFGNNSGAHHLTNLFFHIVNTLLLFVVLKQMTSALWQSAFVAALFALHPLHVESVAWISERKDVLSAFFLFLTIWAYLRYVRQSKIRRYLLIVLFFTLGLMSKAMLVTLPFVLLLLDYWPLERFGKQKISCLILEKVPLFVLSAASSVITFLAQRTGGAVAQVAELGIKFRIYNAINSYVKYIEKMFWPSRLAVFYPHPGENISLFFTVISAVILLIITIIVFAFAKKRRYLFTGWFWYLGTLIPVIGIVQVGSQALADRYTYITLTGLFIIIAWGLPELLEKWRYRKIILRPVAYMVLAVLAVSTYFQTKLWEDDITLYQHTLNVTENNYSIHTFIAKSFVEHGRIDEAVLHNFQALRIKPDYADALNSLGVAYYKTARLDEAIDCYNKAVKINPRQKEVYSNLGMALAAKGEFDKAILLYNKALQIDPDSFNTRLNLGAALTSSGKLEQAAQEYQKILSIQPRNAVSHNDFGVVLFRQGELDEAIVHFRQAVKINPQYSDARNNLNAALAEKQKTQSTQNKRK